MRLTYCSLLARSRQVRRLTLLESRIESRELLESCSDASRQSAGVLERRNTSIDCPNALGFLLDRLLLAIQPIPKLNPRSHKLLVIRQHATVISQQIQVGAHDRGRTGCRANGNPLSSGGRSAERCQESNGQDEKWDSG